MDPLTPDEIQHLLNLHVKGKTRAVLARRRDWETRDYCRRCQMVWPCQTVRMVVEIAKRREEELEDADR